MEQEILVLSLAVLGAAALQAATGIGFGIIAGPILLVVLDDSAAIQISVMLNLLIALLLAPALHKSVEKAVLKSLTIGLLIGTPLGVFIFMQMDLVALKALAGLIVLFTLSILFSNERRQEFRKHPPVRGVERISVGVVAGVMGGSLAMPGPVPAAWMSFRGYAKNAIRSTILVMFVAAYIIALLLQFTVAEIDAGTMKLTAMLAPSTGVGVVAGHFLSTRISEAVFRSLLTVVLGITAVLLFSALI